MQMQTVHLAGIKNTAMYNPSGHKRILFANFPADGHFNPLTSLANSLKKEGFDVRWYTSDTYKPKLEKLQIPHFPFRTAFDISKADIDTVFPERARKKSQVAKLKFDLINAFILRGPEYYADIKEIYQEFPFDLMIADCAFTGIPFVKELLKIPVIAIGVMPLMETSADLAPTGFALTPAKSFGGKLKHAILRNISDSVVFRAPNKIMHKMFDDFGIPHKGESIFDMLIKKSDYLLQSGTPSFEYYRSDLSNNIRFIGALFPESSTGSKQWFDARLNKYARIVIVTQGTVEKDTRKLVEPALEAFKDSNVLVIATTGGSNTQKLRAKYHQQNIIIEDFIPFQDIMPYADICITNGGYGGVMLGIENDLPLIVAGVHEGKNEINARVGHFKLGINLKTETPIPSQIKNAAEEIFTDPCYKNNVAVLAGEFREYNPQELCSDYVRLLLRVPVPKNIASEQLQEMAL
jgi:UDP:flavonoid glycosyltransferase YjiC (YdhE family)